ncbi:MAG TPA: hydrogenase maturation protease, partial [Candidatus Sumerlaeota bacterium]|nr:hydrogenase maturation protease [Candidatus Sumerlaeota bacterium]
MNARGSNSSEPANAPRTARDVLVLGVGNVIRGDDAIGLLLARDLAPVFSSVADFLECESAGYEILDRMTGRKAVVIIDALKTETESEVGDVVSLPVDDAPSSVTLMPSHGFDMTGLIRFFRHAHGE